MALIQMEKPKVERSDEMAREDILKRILTSTAQESDSGEEPFYGNDNHEDLMLIWYGNVNDERKFETFTKPRFRDVINYFKRFRRMGNCFQFISSVSIEKLFVILAYCDQTELQSLLSRLKGIEHVFYIYIYSDRHIDIDENEWNKFPKVQGIFTDEDELLLQLWQDVNSIYLLSFNILKIDGDESSITDLSKENLMFVRSKLLLDHLLTLPAPKSGKRDIVLEFKKEYEGSPTNISNIDKFANNYEPNQAIEWYTKQSFVYKIVNKALRLQDMKIMFKFRFFIVDLHNQLLHLHSNRQNRQACFTVYRGAQLRKNDFNKIINNVGSFISMNTFLSTTYSMQIADLYHKENKNPVVQPVLFKIALDPSSVFVPFAPIEEQSSIPDEEEVLFSINLILKVNNHSQNSDGTWNINLSSPAEKSIDIQRLINACFKNIDERINHNSISNHFIEALCSIDQYKMLEEFYYTYLNDVQHDSFEEANVQANLGYIYYKEGKVSTAVDFFRKAFKTLQEQLKILEQPGFARSLLAKLCEILAVIYISNDNYNEAMMFHWTGLKCEIDQKPIDYEILSRRCSNIAVTHGKAGSYSIALTFFSKAMSYIYISSLTKSIISATDIYYQVATVYEQINKKMALRYANLAFNTAIRLLPNYTNIAVYERNKKMARLSVALNRLSEIVPLKSEQHHILVYEADDLLIFENANDCLPIDAIVIVWLKVAGDSNVLYFNGYNLQVFDDANTCYNYLSSINGQLVFLVVSVSPSNLLIEAFLEHPLVTSIYYIISETFKATRIPSHKKYRGFYSNQKMVTKAIEDDINAFYNHLISINTFNPKISSYNSENMSFIKFHTFINIFCAECKDRAVRQDSIDFHDYEFKKTLLAQNILKLYKYHEVIANLHSKINQHHQKTFNACDDTMTEYYSGIISCRNFHILEKNIGFYVSLNNLIITQSSKYNVFEQVFNTAINYSNYSNYLPIVIEFSIGTCPLREISFAPSHQFLRVNRQGLIFSLGSIFRVEDVKRVYRRNVLVHYLKLSVAPVDPLITKIFNQIKEVVHYSNKQLCLGKFLYFLNVYDEVSAFFSEFLHDLNANDIEQKTIVYIILGDISAKKLHLNEALNYYKEASKLQLSSNRNVSVELKDIYEKMGYVCLQMRKKSKSLFYYLKAIETHNSLLSNSSNNLNSSFPNIALYYLMEGKYQIAHDYLKKSMDCYRNVDYPKNRWLSLNYFYMGICYNCLEKYKEAIECHEEAIRLYMESKISNNRKYVNSNYCYLGLNHFKLKQYSDASNYFNLVIENETDTHNIALACNHLGFINYIQEDYVKSLHWYQRSIENTEDSRQALALHNIGAICLIRKLNNLAIEFLDKAFDCELNSVAKEHPSIVMYYNYIKEIENRYRSSIKTTNTYNRELEAITNLFESKNTNSSKYLIICFDPDDSIEGYDGIPRLRSDKQILQYVENCRAQTIFIITYSDLSILSRLTGKTIHIYWLLKTDQAIIRENIRGCLNDIDQLLIQVVGDLVISEMVSGNGQKSIHGQILMNSNWRDEYFKYLQNYRLQT